MPKYLLIWTVCLALSLPFSSFLFADPDSSALPQKDEKKSVKMVEFRADIAGLFSNLTRVMEWIYSVKQTDTYALYINLQGMYGCADNLFSLLFKECNDPQVTTIPPSRGIIFSSQRYPIFFPKFEKFAADDMMHLAHNKYVYCRGALYTDPDFSLFRNRLHPILRDFFQPTAGLQYRIDEIAQKMDEPNLSDLRGWGQENAQQKNLKIGIHVRCRQHYRGYPHSPDRFLDDIERDVDQMMESKDPQTTRIFLATLIQPLVDRLSAKYNVIACDIPRNDDTFSDWVKTPDANSFDGACDALVDTWCLANCDELWCTSSNMAIFAACLNPNLQIHPLPSLKDYDGW